MAAPDRGGLIRPLYFLSWVFTFVTLEGWFTLLSHHRRRLMTSGGLMSGGWFDPEASARIACNAVWGAAVGGGIIVFLVAFLFAFPAKVPICGVLLLSDLLLFLVGLVNEVGVEGHWMLALLAMVSLVFHHLLYVTVYCFADVRLGPQAEGSPEEADHPPTRTTD